MSEAAFRAHWVSYVGVPEAYVPLIYVSELRIAQGVEERIFDAPDTRKIVGKRLLRDILEANKSCWIN